MSKGQCSPAEQVYQEAVRVEMPAEGDCELGFRDSTQATDQNVNTADAVFKIGKVYRYFLFCIKYGLGKSPFMLSCGGADCSDYFDIVCKILTANSTLPHPSLLMAESENFIASPKDNRPAKHQFSTP